MSGRLVGTFRKAVGMSGGLVGTFWKAVGMSRRLVGTFWKAVGMSEKPVGAFRKAVGDTGRVKSFTGTAPIKERSAKTTAKSPEKWSQVLL